MAFTVAGRVPLSITDGPYAGVQAEVDAIASYPVYAGVLARVAEFVEAEGEDVLPALTELYQTVETVGRPTWNLADAKGPIPATVLGMYRVPVPLMIALVNQWTDTFTPEAADAR